MGLFFNLEVSLLTIVVAVIAIGIIASAIKALEFNPRYGYENSRKTKIACAIVIIIGVIILCCSKPIARGIVTKTNASTETSVDKLFDIDDLSF